MRFVKPSDTEPIMEAPILWSKKELEAMQAHYQELSPLRFGNEFKEAAFRPLIFKWEGVTYPIQLNHCPLKNCPHQFQSLEPDGQHLTWSWPTRTVQSRSFALTGRPADPRVTCQAFSPKAHQVSLYSNASFLGEVVRLKQLEQIEPLSPTTTFHLTECQHRGTTPHQEPKQFRKRGYSSAGATKYQCKTCLKLTNVLPSDAAPVHYRQKRDDLLVDLASDILSRVPVRKSLAKHQIAAGTYYRKLDQLHSQVLGFLTLQEQPLQTCSIPLKVELSQMVYLLNYKRLKGRHKDPNKKPDALLPISIIASIESQTGYVLRVDVAYDESITLAELEQETQQTKADHHYTFNQRFARLSWAYAPQPPTPEDTQTQLAYSLERKAFESQKAYVPGLCVKPDYTLGAHVFWLSQTLQNGPWTLTLCEADEANGIVSRVLNGQPFNAMPILEWVASFDEASTISTFFTSVSSHLKGLDSEEEEVGKGWKHNHHNYNPRYARQLLTLLKAYLNYVVPVAKDGESFTPAQRMGLASTPLSLAQLLGEEPFPPH